MSESVSKEQIEKLVKFRHPWWRATGPIMHMKRIKYYTEVIEDFLEVSSRVDFAQLDAVLLARDVRDARGKMGVREAAKQIGIGHATLSRLERGYESNATTVRKVQKWLKERELK